MDKNAKRKKPRPIPAEGTRGKKSAGRPPVSPERINKFFEVLSSCCNIKRACDAALVSRSKMYELRAQDPAFAARWDAAYKLGIEAMEDEVHRRAFCGVHEDVYHQGQVVGQREVFSDQLAMFMLRGARPDKYKDRVANENVNVNLERGPHSQLTDAEIDAEIKRRLRQ